MVLICTLQMGFLRSSNLRDEKRLDSGVRHGDEDLTQLRRRFPSYLAAFTYAIVYTCSSVMDVLELTRGLQ